MDLIIFNNMAIQRVNRRERIFKDRLNPLEQMSNEDCVMRFRLNKQAINYICSLVNDDLKRSTKRSNALPVVVQVCVSLNFLAQKGFFRLNGDVIGVSKSSVSICLREFLKAFIKYANRFIRFPVEEERLRAIRQDFYEIKGFPKVIGAIDGTHIEIIAPPNGIEHIYVNRKSKHSLNIQAVCDSKLRFLNVVAKWPGKVHDSFIWSTCELKKLLMNRPNLGYLLGDNGYPLENILMTPLSNPRTNNEIRYNEAHMKTRCTIERAFGILKMRFRSLHSQSAGALLFAPKKAAQVIVVCCMLHNIAIERNLVDENITETIEFQEILNYQNEFNNNNLNENNNTSGRVVRNTLIRNVFNG